MPHVHGNLVQHFRLLRRQHQVVPARQRHDAARQLVHPRPRLDTAGVPQTSAQVGVGAWLLQNALASVANGERPEVELRAHRIEFAVQLPGGQAKRLDPLRPVLGGVRPGNFQRQSAATQRVLRHARAGQDQPLQGLQRVLYSRGARRVVRISFAKLDQQRASPQQGLALPQAHEGFDLGRRVWKRGGR